MIRAVSLCAGEPGPHLLVLGAVHGNETCGATAILRFLGEVEKGQHNLTRGRATFVPVCNPRAYAEGLRFVERNLNRFLVPQAKPDSYEARLGNILCPLIERCDALLDLHSYPNGSLPFAFVGAPNEAERAFARSLGVATLLTGWEDAYRTTGRAAAAPKDADESVGTEEYARRCGKIASLLECGDHADPKAPDVAYAAILGALVHFGMTAAPTTAPSPPARHLATIERVFYRDGPGSLTRDWRNLDPVRAGELIAQLNNGQELRAPKDGVLLLPDRHAGDGQEWFYTGKTELMPST